MVWIQTVGHKYPFVKVEEVGVKQFCEALYLQANWLIFEWYFTTNHTSKDFIGCHNVVFFINTNKRLINGCKSGIKLIKFRPHQ